MFKKLLPYILGTSLVLGGTTADLIPVDMKLDHSYSTECSALNATTTTNKTTVPWDDETPYKPDVCNGNLYVSVFKDFKGQKVYEVIGEKSYTDMGKVDGFKLNTQKNELISAVEYAANIAEAAIAHDAFTSCRANPGTSCTVAHTVTGSNTFGYGVQMTFQNKSFNGNCTWNGTAMSSAGEIEDTTANRKARGVYLASPATGNVVCSVTSSTLIYHSESSYTGAAGTIGATTTQKTTTGTLSATAGGLTIIETTTGSDYLSMVATIINAVSGNDWLIGGHVANPSSEPTAGANTTRRGLDPDWATGIFDSNNTAPTGGATPSPDSTIIILFSYLWNKTFL